MIGDMEKGLLSLIKYSRDPKKQKEDKLAKALEDENTDALADTIFKNDQVFWGRVCFVLQHKANFHWDFP